MLFLIAPAALWAYVWSYQLRLDEFGLWRRRLWFWTQWSWEDFRDGAVVCDPRLPLLSCRTRPLWDRWMIPIFLASEDGLFFFEVVKQTIPAECWLETTPISLPNEELREVTLRLSPWGTIRIDGLGIIISNGNHLPWDQVAHVRVEKRRNKSCSIYRVTLTPRNGRPTSGLIADVRLNEHWLKGINKGDDEWVRRVETLVPSKVWAYFRMDGDLRSAAEAEFRMAHWKTMRQVGDVFRWVSLLVLPLAAFVFVPKMLAFWNQPFMALPMKIIALVCFGLTMIMQPVLLYLVADLLARSGESKLEETQAELAKLAQQKSEESMGVTLAN